MTPMNQNIYSLYTHNTSAERCTPLVKKLEKPNNVVVAGYAKCKTEWSLKLA